MSTAGLWRGTVRHGDGSRPEVMRHTTGRIEPTDARRAELLSAFSATPAADLGHGCVEHQGGPIGWVSLTPLEAAGRTHPTGLSLCPDRLGSRVRDRGLRSRAWVREGSDRPCGMRCHCLAQEFRIRQSSVHTGVRNESRAIHYGREMDVFRLSLEKNCELNGCFQEDLMAGGGPMLCHADRLQSARTGQSPVRQNSATSGQSLPLSDCRRSAADSEAPAH